jgi:hypothetical protein
LHLMASMLRTAMKLASDNHALQYSKNRCL